MFSIEQFIEKIVENCKNRSLEKWQINYSAAEQDSLSVFEGKTNEASSSNRIALTFSAIINGKVGRFSTNRFNDEDVETIVKNAIINAETITIDEEMFFHDGSGEYIEVERYSPKVEKLDSLDKLQFLLDVERKAYEYDERIDKIIYCEYDYSKSFSIMRNSLGLNLKRESVSASAVLYARAKMGDEVKTYFDFVDFSNDEDFIPETLVNKTCSKLLKRLGSVATQSKNGKVIFSPDGFRSILSNISGLFSIYDIDRGFSKFKDSLSKKIASSKVSIIDNPHIKGGAGTSSFDGDGVATKNKIIIKNGILETYLYNLPFAHKYNVETTGNGTGGLGTTVFNFYVEKGSVSEKELLKMLGNGVYIDKLSGVHAGIDVVSGDFSVAAEGFLVENELISKPLKQFTISGNLYELLKDIIEVADNLDFNSSSIGSPSILVNNITIASE